VLLVLHNKAAIDSVHITSVLVLTFIWWERSNVKLGRYVTPRADNDWSVAGSTFRSHRVSPVELILLIDDSGRVSVDIAIYVGMPSIIFSEIGFSSLVIGTRNYEIIKRPRQSELTNTG
jgi:hypothetical protein